MDDLRRTDLNGLHREFGAKMVPFAGWEMPVQFPAGVMAEHLQTRARAGLFDVGHMGQVILRAPSGRAEDAALALEALVPADVAGLGEGRQRYAVFTDAGGGILDDLMVANRGDHLFLVVNAARAEHDVAHLRQGLDGMAVEVVEDRALLALQGPAAATALARLVPEVEEMRFMDARVLPVPGGEVWVSRSGYTGEDGFELSVPSSEAVGFARALLAMEEVAPIGLGARDSLRLEAGLCLYGHDIDETTSPVEAGLAWSIGRDRRRGGAREGGFPGADRILAELADGPARRRVGLTARGPGADAGGHADLRRRDGGGPRDIGRVRSHCGSAGVDGICARGTRRCRTAFARRGARQTASGPDHAASVHARQFQSLRGPV